MNSKLCATLLAAFLIGCEKEEPPETFLPVPDWLESAELTPFKSIEDIRSFWREKSDYGAEKSIREKNGRDFYKSCYYAIANERENESLRVYCLASMGSRVLERADKMKLLQNVVDNHYDFDSDVSNCANCGVGDTVANAVRKLAWLERHNGNTDQGIQLLTTLLDQRKDDIPDYTQMNLYGILAAVKELEPYRDRTRAGVKYFKTLEENYAELVGL